MCAMNRIRLALTVAGMAIGALVFHAQSPAPPLAHKFTEIAPGIYSAVGSAAINAGSNSAVIVNQDDVVIVDSHMTPEAGRALVRDLKTITDKPVKFLINTHFHYDHTDGNQAFWPVTDSSGKTTSSQPASAVSAINRRWSSRLWPTSR